MIKPAPPRAARAPLSAPLPALAALLLTAAFTVPAPTPATAGTGASAVVARRAAPKTADAPMRANGDFRYDLDMARNKVYPALVNIAVVAQEYSAGRAEQVPAGGSGVIVSPDGYVLTNFHVAGHTTRITCTTNDGAVYDAAKVGDDPYTDISVLKLALPAGHAPMTYAELGDSDKMQVGDFVLAMGNPLLLSSSMTLGIVSNTHRVFTDFTGTQIQQMELDSGEQSGEFTRWIQHDALILPGNSGGPLVNLSGQVIGINELGGDGVGFAIPSDIARGVYQEIRQRGSVHRGWMGVGVLPVQKLGRATGTLVASVTPGSPADKIGVKPGDIITSIDGKPTNTQFFEQVPLFYQRVAAVPAGTAVKVAFVHNGAAETQVATVQPLQPSLGSEAEFSAAGVTVRSITPEMAQARYLASTNGVLVTGVRSGYPFEGAQPSIAAGDIITSVADHPITTLASFQSAMTAATKASDPGDKVVIALRRDDEQMLSTAVLKPTTDTGSSDSELPQAWVGIRTQVVTPDIAAAVGQPSLKGFRVTEVYPYTAAERSGLKVGDIITSLNGTALTASRAQDAFDLRQAIQGLSIGDKASMTVERGGQAQTINVPLEAAPAPAAQAKAVTQNELGFSVREISDIDRYTNHWTLEQKGLLVTDVTEGGYASIAGLQVDDLIVSIDGVGVSKVGDLKSAMTREFQTKPRNIEIYVRRDASTQFVFIEPEWSKITQLTEQQQ